MCRAPLSAQPCATALAVDDGDPRGKGLLWCLSNLTQRVTILGLYSHQQERGREQALCILQGRDRWSRPLEEASLVAPRASGPCMPSSSWHRVWLLRCLASQAGHALGFQLLITGALQLGGISSLCSWLPPQPHSADHSPLG